MTPSRRPRSVPTTPPPELAGEDLLTVTEAADLTGVARSTLALWTRSGRFPRATVLQLGKVRAGWYIPITDLISAGLVPARRARKATKTAPTRQHNVVIADLQRRVGELTTDLQRARGENERLELLTREQQAIITDLRRQLAKARR